MARRPRIHPAQQAGELEFHPGRNLAQYRLRFLLLGELLLESQDQGRAVEAGVNINPLWTQRLRRSNAGLCMPTGLFCIHAWFRPEPVKTVRHHWMATSSGVPRRLIPSRMVSPACWTA